MNVLYSGTDWQRKSALAFEIFTGPVGRLVGAGALIAAAEVRIAGRGAAEVRSAGRGAADAVVSSVRGATAALRGCRPFWHLPELPDRPVRA